MRIGRETLLADLLTEIQELLLGQASFDEGAGVNSGRAVALEIDEVAAMRVACAMPEMHEARVVQRRRRLEARDMAAQFRRLLVGFDDDRRRVPAYVPPDELLDLPVSRMRRLGLRRDGVDIGGIGGKRQPRSLPARRSDNGIKDFVDPADPLEGLHGIERIEPLIGFVVLSCDSVVHRAGLPRKS
jgi:hypothetical protein